MQLGIGMDFARLPRRLPDRAGVKAERLDRAC
jgi:hypothetical protein